MHIAQRYWKAQIPHRPVRNPDEADEKEDFLMDRFTEESGIDFGAKHYPTARHIRRLLAEFCAEQWRAEVPEIDEHRDGCIAVTAVRSGYVWNQIKNDDMGGGEDEQGRDHVVIVLIDDWTDPVWRPEFQRTVAIANLVAAAPAMYKALKARVEDNAPDPVAEVAALKMARGEHV